ncbi:MAG: oligosaccharide flippase family protein [Meiothermus sp.]|nr:oligosaccharide flippase family protein [Meiothermus sp.]
MESESVNSTQIARSAARGAVALGIRQLLVQGSNVATGIVLARILAPSEFALWGIITFVLSFLIAFGDAGLAASLVRQQKEPHERDYQAIFTVQQILVLGVAAVFWLLAPWIAELYKLSPQDVWVFRFVAVALVLTSLMVIPQAKLERNLAFDKLAVVEVSQALVYNVSTILLALNGMGALSFGLALLLRSLTGAVLAYWVSPWHLRLIWDWGRVQPHLAFGLPFQGSKLVNLLKDLISPTFFVLYVGTTAVGYINWATMVTNYPLLAVTLLQRLYLPVFARLAGRTEFNQALHRIVTVILLLVYVASLLVFVFRREITTSVFGEQWLEALVVVPPLILISFILAPAIIAMSALNALGYSRTVFLTNISVAVATWLIGTLSIMQFGWQGWGWANFAIHCLYLPLLSFVSRRTGFNWWPSLIYPILIATGAALVGAIAKTIMPWWVALGLSLFAAVVLSHRVWLEALKLTRNR